MLSSGAQIAGSSSIGPRAALAAAAATCSTCPDKDTSTPVTASGSSPSSRVAACAGPVIEPSAAADDVPPGSSPATAAAAPNAIGSCGPYGCSDATASRSTLGH